MGVIDAIVKRLNLSDTKELVVRNVLWSLLGKIITLFGNLFVGIIIARYLGPTQYGLMNYVISFVTLFQIISSFGLDNIEVREEAKGDVPANIVIGSAFRIRAYLAILTVLATILTSFLYEADIITVCYVTIYSLSIVAKTLDVIRNRFTSLVKNEFVVKSEISRTFLGIVIKIIMLIINASLVWFIIATTFDFFLLAGGYVYSYHRQIGSIKLWKYDKQYAKFLLKEAFPLLLTSAAVFVYQRIDQVMIGNLVDVDMDKTSVGYFATASRFVEILMFIPHILTLTISPILVKCKQRSEHEYRLKAQQFMSITVWLSFLLSIGLSLIAYWVILLTFGEEYEESIPVLRVLSFKAAAFALSTTAGSILVLEGKQKYAIIRDLFGCVVCVCLNFIFLPIYGIMAAAYIAIISLLCAGYIGDLIVPSYRHIFKWQTKSIFTGWSELIHLKSFFNKT